MAETEPPSAEETAKTPSPDAALYKLKIIRRPDKTEYMSGETFDPAGLVIDAVYSDGSVVGNVGYQKEQQI